MRRSFPPSSAEAAAATAASPCAPLSGSHRPGAAPTASSAPPHPCRHTCATTQRLALLLRALGFGAVPLHGQLSQPMRLSALLKFKSGERNVLLATDVASRGLDIPSGV